MPNSESQHAWKENFINITKYLIDFTKEIADGIPVPGLKSAIGSLAKVWADFEVCVRCSLFIIHNVIPPQRKLEKMMRA